MDRVDLAWRMISSGTWFARGEIDKEEFEERRRGLDE